MLLKFNNIHYQYLAQLPKISQSVSDIKFFYNPSNFRDILLKKIADAKQRVCIVALYLEQDKGGSTVLNALYKAKFQKPKLNISVLVDWHRAQRGRIGLSVSNTNADWYYSVAQKNIGIDIPIYGVPINFLEAFGVLHLKGFIIDDFIFYSGANLNNLYLHQFDKYSYDRYHLIKNTKMANAMFNWIDKYLIHSAGVYLLNIKQRPKNLEIKNKIRIFRKKLRHSSYNFSSDANNYQLSVTPIVGLGKSNLLNKTIFNLILCTKEKITICTPYFNLPKILLQSIIKLLRNGKQVEIIVGDKTANDFFIPEDKPFKIIGTLPYLYEINLRIFLNRLQCYIKIGQLNVRIWKNKNNSYHLKGIWVDNEWILITGNNLNPRAWHLDLENAILIHDPCCELTTQCINELEIIRNHTTIIHNYSNLQSIANYPVKIRKLIRYLRHIKIDKLINIII